MAIDVRILASSSAGNCAHATDGKTPLLLDCGIRFAEIQRRTGFKVSQLGGCLLSHEHGDHSRAVRDLMKAGVDVWASRGTLEALEIHSGHRARALRMGEFGRANFDVGTWQALAFSVPHDAADPLGFLLQSGDEKLVYVSDCAYCPYRFEGLTHIMVECNWSGELLKGSPAEVQLKRRILSTHMSLDRVLGFLQANELSSVREIHLLHLSDDHSDEEQFKTAVERATGKPVYVAPRDSISSKPEALGVRG